MVTRESVASGSQHQLYDGTKIKGTLTALDMSWEYTPIDSVIASVAETYRRHSSGS
jgi:hypothetical protein